MKNKVRDFTKEVIKFTELALKRGDKKEITIRNIIRCTSDYNDDGCTFDGVIYGATKTLRIYNLAALELKNNFSFFMNGVNNLMNTEYKGSMIVGDQDGDPIDELEKAVAEIVTYSYHIITEEKYIYKAGTKHVIDYADKCIDEQIDGLTLLESIRMISRDFKVKNDFKITGTKFGAENRIGSFGAGNN